MCLPPVNSDFVGMIDYAVKSFYDLLVGDSESPSSSNSNGGSHHPSQEYFMDETPEGHVESDQGNKATPTNNLGYELEEYT